jgi:WD40 repeat protein/CHAT domain-containing protein
MVMSFHQSHPVHRSLSFLVGIVFATATTTPVNAQPALRTVAQMPATESTTTGNKESVQAFAGQLAIFLGHEGSINSALFSPDGQKILSAGDDGTVRLWDFQGNLLAIFRGHEGRVTSAVFSPDGTQILSAGDDGIPRLWDIQGNLLKEFRGNTNKKYVQAVFNPNGKQILTIEHSSTDSSKITRLWDSSGNFLKELTNNEWAKDTFNTFSPDGKQILTTNGKIARLWDISGNLLTEFPGHEQKIWRATFSPDGRQIVTLSHDKTAYLWDVSGNLLAEFRGHEDVIWTAVFSPDGQQILTSSWDTTARLWDTQGNSVVVLRGYKKAVNAKFSPTGRQIITVSGDGIAHLWDTKGNLLAEFQVHNNQVERAEFSPDGGQILTTSSDKSVRLWDISAMIAGQTEQMSALQALRTGISEKNAQLLEFPVDEGRILGAVFSPDGRQVLTANGDGTARLWDRSGVLVAKLPVYEGEELPGYEKTIHSALFSPNGTQILTASYDGNARVWDTQGNLLLTLKHEDWVKSAVFSPDGGHILTTCEDGIARLWDISGQLLVEFPDHQFWSNSAVFSPDGRQVITVSYGGIINLWDTQGNLLLEFQGHQEIETSAIFSPDGRQILSAGGQDKTARLWDIKGNLLVEFRGHKDSVESAVFSPDGSQVLTSSADKTARLWDTQGNLLAIFRGHEDRLISAVFSPDGQQILTASLDDGTARLWDVSIAITAQAEETAAQQAFQQGVSEKNAPQANEAFQQATQLNQQGTLESRKLALQKLQEALTLYRSDHNSEKEAQTLLLIGNIHADLGQFQNALDSYNQALPLSQKAGAKAEEADILNNLGELYNELADSKTALIYFNQALPLYYQLNNPGAVATTFNNIGEIQITSAEGQNALKSYNQALIVARYGGDLDAEASALMGIGNIYIASQDRTTALNAYNQALLISRHLNNKAKETSVINQRGKIYAALGQISQAAESYNQALSLSQQLGYQTEEADILYNQAILSRQQNNLTTAKTEVETAISIIENLRTQIASQELRQSYFARNQDYYEFYIDLLMQLHQQDPNKGYDAEALHISERARARSLLELLTEATAEIRSGVDSTLLEQEQNLQQQLNALDHKKYQLVSGSYSQTELDEIQKKIASTLTKLDQVEAQIRISSPRYADLKYPEPLTLSEIQQQVLDEETVLLEYALGEEQSYLWVVTKNSLNSYILPKQSEIEAAAKTYRESFTLDSTAKIETGLSLSQMLLKPVISQLGNKRLLMVGDGILQTIPFAALPLPTDINTPLLVQNEIVTLPSASTVAIQRRQLENRPPAEKTLAVLADPVFNTSDSRIAGTSGQQNASLNTNALTRATRNLGIGEGPAILDPLPYTRTEAEKILALVPEAQRLQAFGLDASRQLATDPTLAQYQIIHLATHGLLDSVNPELSGVVLSLFDKAGQPQDGFLRLNDIFNLNLPAELVVLSACQTGLGEAVRGEGLVGLTRGFMYAGARRVVVSLWSVSDSATAELMSEFYQKMLNEKQEPVSALRAAQLEMWNAGKSPYYWAAFTVQGDWR